MKFVSSLIIFTFLLSLLPSAITSSSSTSPLSYFISPIGSDTSGDGTIDNPWASLSFAATSIRPSLSTMSANISVFLRSGTYFMSSPFVLMPQDSGQNGFYVIYTQYPPDSDNSTSNLDGGIPLQGFTPLGPSFPLVYSSPLPSSVLSSRQVYLLSSSALPSRMNESATTSVNFTSANTHVLPTGYLTNDTSLLQLLQLSSSTEQQASDVEFLYTSAAAQWQESRSRVESWEILNTTTVTNNITCPCINITMQQPGFTLVRTKAYAEVYPTSLTNFIALLQPGQGYISLSLGKIFYAPRPEIDTEITQNGSAILAALDGPLISLVGENISSSSSLSSSSSSASFSLLHSTVNPVSNIVIANLTLQHTTWNVPTTTGGYAPDQGGIIYLPEDLQPDNSPLPGHASHPVPSRGIQLSTVRNIVIESCNLYRIGATAISIENGSQNVRVSHNRIQDTSCGAIRIGQVDDKEETDVERMTSGILIEDNYMFGIAMEYRDCSGIFGGYVSNTTILHNTLLNTSWAGVTLGWGGWGGCPIYNTLGGNRILSNYISYVNLVVGDGGPIYVMAPQPVPFSNCSASDLTCRSEMAYNYVSYAIHHAALLYHDEGTGFYYTHDNVALQPQYTDPHGWWWSYLAAWASSEHNIFMVNNTARGVSRADIYKGNNLVVENSTLLPLGNPWPPAAQEIVDQAGVRGIGVSPKKD